jgi:hypothetical protein
VTAPLNGWTGALSTDTVLRDTPHQYVRHPSTRQCTWVGVKCSWSHLCGSTPACELVAPICIMVTILVLPDFPFRTRALSQRPSCHHDRQKPSTLGANISRIIGFLRARQVGTGCARAYNTEPYTFTLLEWIFLSHLPKESVPATAAGHDQQIEIVTLTLLVLAGCIAQRTRLVYIPKT